MNNIPRNIEVLITKAAVDKKFRQKLYRQRSAVAECIGLELKTPEKNIIDHIPEEQLAVIIDKTVVPKEHHSVFMGKVSALMLAALGAAALFGCDRISPVSKGIRPEPAKQPKSATTVKPPTSKKEIVIPDVEKTGDRIPKEVISSDIQSPETSEDIMPNVSLGIRADRPDKKR